MAGRETFGICCWEKTLDQNASRVNGRGPRDGIYSCVRFFLMEAWFCLSTPVTSNRYWAILSLTPCFLAMSLAPAPLWISARSNALGREETSRQPSGFFLLNRVARQEGYVAQPLNPAQIVVEEGMSKLVRDVALPACLG